MKDIQLFFFFKFHFYQQHNIFKDPIVLNHVHTRIMLKLVYKCLELWNIHINPNSCVLPYPSTYIHKCQQNKTCHNKACHNPFKSHWLDFFEELCCMITCLYPHIWIFQVQDDHITKNCILMTNLLTILESLMTYVITNSLGRNSLTTSCIRF
jgi:hypothetical protein